MPRELGNVNDQFVQMVNTALDQRDGSFRFCAGRVLAQHFHPESNAAKRILNLVRKLRRC